MRIVAECCKGIARLRIRGCGRLTGGCLESFAKHCPRLTHLDASYVPGLSQNGVIAVARHALASTSAPPRPPAHSYMRWCRRYRACQLKVLELASMHQSGFRLHDHAVDALRKHCACLEAIDIRNHAYLSDVACKGLVGACQGLRELYLSGCVLVSNAVLIQLAESCQASLERVGLKGCVAITNDGVNAVMASCRRLQSLDIGDCRGLDYNIAIVLAEAGSHRLQEIHLDELRGLSDRIMIGVALSSPELSFLSVMRCMDIKVETRDLLRQQKPMLTVKGPGSALAGPFYARDKIFDSSPTSQPNATPTPGPQLQPVTQQPWPRPTASP